MCIKGTFFFLILIRSNFTKLLLNIWGSLMLDKLNYDEIINLASEVFTSPSYTIEEKQELYLKICEMYNIYT